VKNRGTLTTVVGMFNMRKTASPWREIRLRRAVNFAINRSDLTRYAAQGNGVITPALVPVQGFGYDPDLAARPFDPARARNLLREAGYPDGLSVTLIAPDGLEPQATVVSKMLEQVGLKVERHILDGVAFNRKTFLGRLDQPAEQQKWDIALVSFPETLNFPVFLLYHWMALDGPADWVMEEPELRQLYEQVLATVDRDKQQRLIRQMERHTADQAYFLFLYNPIKVYAANKAVKFVPYANTILYLDETWITDRHWSVRKGAAKQ